MRYLGLVEWFDHYNGCGCIWSDNKGKLRINQSKLNNGCIEEGDYVTFSINERNGSLVGLCLLKDEVDLNSIQDIFMHNMNRIDIWNDTKNDNVIRKYFRIAKVNDIKQVFLKIIPQLTKERKDQLLSYLPEGLLFADDIWQVLSDSEKLKTILKWMNKSIDLNSNMSMKVKVIDLLTILKSDKRKLILDKLSVEIKYDIAIFDLLDVNEKIRLINELFEKGSLGSEEYKTKFIQSVDNSSQSIIDDVLRNIPTALRQDKDIFPILHSIDQINVLCEHRNKSNDYWPLMSLRAQLATILRCDREGLGCNWLKMKDNDPIINLLIHLTNKELDTYEKRMKFQELHTELQNRIIEKAWDVTQSVDLVPLLPECKYEIVNYCEGKIWTNVNDGVFCPRSKNKCSFDEGARIKPNCLLPWYEWTLLEFIKSNKIDVKIEGLDNAEEYVPRMGGWVNRVNEIREVLKCSICGETLVSNMQYSKNLARYNSTIFYCPNGEDHDKDVYISHCWACRKIVDSRKDKIRYHNKYYLCLDCGSGPSDSETFSQGDICPSCGHNHLVFKDTSTRIKICSRCGHTLELPPDWKITGIRKW